MMKYKKRFVFSTKAETLEKLKPLLKNWVIPESYSFSVSDWKKESEVILNNIKSLFNGSLVIIRSSSIVEDGEFSAQAGAYLSLPNIDSSNADDLRRSVESVINSFVKYQDDNRDHEDFDNNQILIQEMISNVNMSGVLFTQELSTGAPYYVINYDDESGTTDSVTRGDYNNRTLYIFRDAIDKITSPRFKKLLNAVMELEYVVDDDCIDIEFAINGNEDLILFQARRITTQPNWNRGLYLRIKDAIESISNGLIDRYSTRGLSGNYEFMLGNMPDWNPAEIIGTTPRPLAYSLYRYLITDSTWRIARKEMGYRENTGMPLMLSLAGRPYIDVKQSFYSYLPNDVPEKIADKLVSAWLERLKANHHLHDKVEFDVAITIYTPDFSERVSNQFPAALTNAELDIFKNSLLKLTNNILTTGINDINHDLTIVENMNARREAIHAKYKSPSLEAVSSLLEDTIRFGTIPFSKLARHGFIASSFLKSLVSSGVLNEDDVINFQKSVPTVASEFISDLGNLKDSDEAIRKFLDKYGHLRPGTYDILSMRYDERDISMFSLHDLNKHKEINEFTLTDKQNHIINELLSSHGLSYNARDLFGYMRNSIQAREYAKFLFTRNLSDALEILTSWGGKHGLSKEELSFLDIRDILDCMICFSGRTIEEHLRNYSETGRKYYEITSSIKLPFLIYDLSDLYIVPLSVEHPNYITRKNDSGPVIHLKGGSINPEELDNKIVAIESADPGFDWIFTRPIKGLITKYGGANSHMAIRCAEFNLPSAIGCGEQIFERVISSSHVELKCSTGQIIIP